MNNFDLLVKSIYTRLTEFYNLYNDTSLIFSHFVIISRFILCFLYLT